MSPSGSSRGPALPDSGGGGALRFRVGVARPLPAGGGEDRLLRLLAEAGMEGVSFPLTRTLPPREGGPLRRGARRWLEGEVDVLLFTSPRGVAAFRGAVDALVGAGGDVPAGSLPAAEVWVVGEETGRVAASLGFPPTRVPERFVAEGLIAALPEWGPLEGKRVLSPRAAVARDVIVDALVSEGAQVTLVEAYRSEPDLDAARALWAALGEQPGLDAVVFTASSQLQVLAQAAERSQSQEPAPTLRGLPWPTGTKLIALGPVTADTALRLGLPVAAVAEPHTVEGVMRALASLFS